MIKQARLVAIAAGSATGALLIIFHIESYLMPAAARRVAR
jgi:hypothetical protein